MNTSNSSYSNDNRLSSIIKYQKDLKSNFEHIDDSLFSLSLRQPKISESVNKHITDVFYNLDQSLYYFSENVFYKAISSQQYVLTSSNALADLLSEILDNMEMDMMPSMGSGQGQQLQDIIMSQEELKKELEEELNKSGKNEKGESQQPDGSSPSNSDSNISDGNKENNQSNGNKQSQNSQGSSQGNSNQSDSNKGKENGSKPGGDKGQGYGEGGNEEFNEKLYSIYKKQQILKQQLLDRFSNSKLKNELNSLIKDMEKIELDLLNNGITKQTSEQMTRIKHQMLKLENASFKQEFDNKRQSKTNTSSFNGSDKTLDTIKLKLLPINEVLNRSKLPLQPFINTKVKSYFEHK